MPAYFDSAGRPRCSRCYTDLSGREHSGRCPSCNTWYDAGHARVEPGRYRMLALRRAEFAHLPRALAENVMASLRLRAASFLILVGGNILVVGGTGYLAIRTFLKMCGVQIW